MFWRKKKPAKDFFVSIGAGINQIPLINEAKKRGFQVIAVDMNSSAPGFYHCDLKVQESIEDYENIYIKLRELLIDGKISAVMTKSYGPAIISTAYLCEKFGLPFMPVEESRKFLNKKLTKKIYDEKNILTPTAINITLKTRPDSIRDKLYPVIAKPQTGHAKVNVQLLKTPEEMKVFMSSQTVQNYIFEQLIPGDEIICAGIIHDKKYYHVLMTDKKTTDPPYFADIMHTAPSVHQDMINSTAETGQLIADAFNIQTSPLIMEFIIGQDGKLYLLEAVPEFGGEFIPDVMIPAATGYNHIENAIRALTSYDFRPPLKIPVNNAVAVRYITGSEGVLSSFSTDSVNGTSGIIFTRIFKHIGDRVSPASTNHDRIGVVIATGKTVQQAVENTIEAERKMNIRIKKDKNEKE